MNQCKCTKREYVDCFGMMIPFIVCECDEEVKK